MRLISPWLKAEARRWKPQWHSCIGDAIWDMLAARRCKATGIGLLSGGYDTGELERAGALRVYEDPLALLQHLDEVASRP